MKSLQAKEAAHTSEAAQRWCQNKFAKRYTKRTTATANSPDLNMWSVADENRVQRSSPQNTGRAEKATKLRLEKCDLRLYKATKLAHSIPRRLENVTKK